MEWLIFVSGGIISELWCNCNVTRPSESGLHWTYDTELVINMGSETKSLSGQVDSAIS